MSFDIVGNLDKIFDTQVISDKFKKREFVLEIKDGNYFINLQVANLSLDASLSRPVLYPIIT